MRKQLLIILLLIVNWQFSAGKVFAQTLIPEQKICPPGETPFTPGGDCAKTTDYFDSRIPTYPLTCQDTPTVRLNRIVPDYVSPGIMPVTLNVDISQAELGGLGPNQQAYQGRSSDYLSQYYPFNALFDKPLIPDESPREQSQAFWRFLNSYQQANAKATFLKQVRTNSPPINNDSIVFYSDTPPESETPLLTPTPTPPPSPAEKNYGFNWGYGHLDQKACQDAAGRAVTFMLPLQAPESQLQEYRDCYRGASTRIVRITDFDGSTPVAAFTAAGSAFQKVFSGDYVELGNELNNLSLEYPNCGTDLAVCGTHYGDQFSAFRQTFTGNLSAAALDTSNADYDAALFLSGALNQAYRQANFIAANSYKNAGGCGQRCSEKSYLWLAGQIGTGKNIILTEYGLAPGTDNKLTDVLDFYNNNIPTDVFAVTPL